MFFLLSIIFLTNLVFENGVSPVHGGFIKDGGVLSLVNPLMTIPQPAAAKSAGQDSGVQKPRDEPPEIIEYGDYVSETHHATTGDGFIIKMFRILPKDKNARGKGMPVYIGHGLLSSAADWLMLPHNQALPFQLANEGYDVWLGNSRGNEYSSQHIRYFSGNDKYWNFSVHEMGQYDVPAVIDYILNNTEEDFKKINYIGYSMSTTSFFICMSENPQYNDKINKMVALAPAIYLNNIKSPAKAAALLNDRVQLLIHQELMGGQLLPWKLVKSLQRVTPLCHVVPDIGTVDDVTDRICQNIVHLLCGGKSDETNTSAVQRSEDYSPSPASARTLIHYIQFFREGIFRQYDWEEKENLKQYNMKTPPEYKLKRTNVTMLFMYGGKDALTVPEDVERTIDELREANPTIKNITVPPFNHLDFVYGKNALEKVYKPLIKWLSD